MPQTRHKAATRVETVRPSLKAATRSTATQTPEGISVNAHAASTNRREVAATATASSKDTKTMQDTIKSATAKAETLFAEFNDHAKAAFGKGSKAFDDANEFTKGNVEAFVESSKIAAKGLETFGQDVAEYSRRSFEQATAAAKAFTGAKSPSDLLKLQGDFARTAFDTLVAQASKNTESLLKLAGEVAQPLSNRAALAVEKVKVAA